MVALFKKFCDVVTISDNKNRYESLDEMKSTVGPRIKSLDIRGERPGVHFLLNQKEYPPGSTTPAIFNELRTEEITDKGEDLFLRVKEFLAEHQRPSSTRFLIPAIAGLLGAACLVAYGVAIALQGQRFRIGLGLVGCLILSVLPTVLGVANAQNYLMLETRLNSPPFFVRNREEFAKQAVTAGIGAVIGGLIGYCIGHFLK